MNREFSKGLSVATIASGGIFSAKAYGASNFLERALEEGGHAKEYTDYLQNMVAFEAIVATVMVFGGIFGLIAAGSKERA